MPIFEQKFDLNATGTDYKSNLKVNRLSNVGLAGVKLRMEGTVVVKDSAKLGYYCTFIYDESKNPNPICLRYRTKQAIVVSALGISPAANPNFWLDTVRTSILKYQEQIVSQNPNSGESITAARAAYISKSIRAGHVRRPHLKQFKGKTALILISATVVNPTKRGPVQQILDKEAAQAMTDKAREMFAGNPNISQGNFRTWVLNEFP